MLEVECGGRKGWTGGWDWITFTGSFGVRAGVDDGTLAREVSTAAFSRSALDLLFRLCDALIGKPLPLRSIKLSLSSLIRFGLVVDLLSVRFVSLLLVLLALLQTLVCGGLLFLMLLRHFLVLFLALLLEVLVQLGGVFLFLTKALLFGLFGVLFGLEAGLLIVC